MRDKWLWGIFVLFAASPATVALDVNFDELAGLADLTTSTTSTTTTTTQADLGALNDQLNSLVEVSDELETSTEAPSAVTSQGRVSRSRLLQILILKLA